MNRESKHRVRLVLGLAAAAAVTGCAEPKSHVRVTSLQPLTHKDPTGGKCEPRGEAEGLGTSETEARSSLMAQAREVGADTVLIDQPTGRGVGRRLLLHAQLLRCHGSQRSAQGAGGSSEPAAPAAPAEASVEERLAEAKGLFDQGLITQEEYDAKRKKILEDL